MAGGSKADQGSLAVLKVTTRLFPFLVDDGEHRPIEMQRRAGAQGEASPAAPTTSLDNALAWRNTETNVVVCEEDLLQLDLCDDGIGQDCATSGQQISLPELPGFLGDAAVELDHGFGLDSDHVAPSPPIECSPPPGT